MRVIAMDRFNFDLAADRARRERLDAERQALKAVAVASFHCDDCDHYLPYRERARSGRCWSCQRTRKVRYQRKYRAFRARAKAQGGRCPICNTAYEFPGGPFAYRRPRETEAGDMICTRCANVIGLVGADKRTLLAIVKYLSGSKKKL
jgi:hypothetical protein